VKTSLVAAACSGLWLLGSYAAYRKVWGRRFFAYTGVTIACLYWGALGLAELQKLTNFPNPRTAEVPFIGMFVGAILGPAVGIALGYLSMLNSVFYGIGQAISAGFLFCAVKNWR
jgi:hypothetical protein